MMRNFLLSFLLLVIAFNGSIALCSGCDLNRADTLFKSGKYREAAASYINCARLEELNDKFDGELIYKWYKEASYCYFADKDMAGALNTMEEALAWAKRNGNKVETAESYFNRGTILIRRRQLRDALYSIEKALSLFKELKRPEDIVRSMNKTASVNLRMEKFSEAESILLKSMDICEEKGLDQGKTDVARLLGDLYCSVGSYEKAEKNYAKALKSYQSLGDDENSAEIHTKLGDIKKEKKEFNKAFELYQKAAGLFEKAGNTRMMNLVKFKTAFYYSLSGEHDKAVEIFTPFIPVNKKKGKKAELKQVLSKELVYFASIGMGDLEKDKNNFKKSLEYYLKAIDAGYKGYDTEDEISLLVKIAESLAFSGDYENAMAFYRDAESKLTDFEGVKLKTDLYMKMGRLASGYRLYDSAISFYEDALSLNRDNPLVKSEILTIIGEIYYFKNDLILSEKMLVSARSAVEKMNEKAKGEETTQIKTLLDTINSFLFMTGFEKTPLKSLTSFLGKDSSDQLIEKLKGSSLLFYKTVKGSGDIFGNISKSTALVVVNGNRIKGYRIKYGELQIKKGKMPLKSLVAAAMNRRIDKLEYLIDSYKTLSVMKNGKKKERLKKFTEKEIFNILLRPCFNDLNGSKDIIVVTDSRLLKGIPFKELNPGNRKFGEIFNVAVKDLSYLMGDEKKKP